MVIFKTPRRPKGESTKRRFFSTSTPHELFCFSYSRQQNGRFCTMQIFVNQPAVWKSCWCTSTATKGFYSVKIITPQNDIVTIQYDILKTGPWITVDFLYILYIHFFNRYCHSSSMESANICNIYATLGMQRLHILPDIRRLRKPNIVFNF